MPSAKTVYGYEIRDPYPAELGYFRRNQGVAGMAAEDGRIVLNPESGLSPEEMQAVARNEAARLFIRQGKHRFTFDITPAQRRAFVGTPYEADDDALRATLLGRILSGDPSAGDITDDQRYWSQWLLNQLEAR